MSYSPHVHNRSGAGRDEVLGYVSVMDGEPCPGEEGTWWVQSKGFFHYGLKVMKVWEVGISYRAVDSTGDNVDFGLGL